MYIILQWILITTIKLSLYGTTLICDECGDNSENNLVSCLQCHLNTTDYLRLWNCSNDNYKHWRSTAKISGTRRYKILVLEKSALRYRLTMYTTDQLLYVYGVMLKNWFDQWPCKFTTVAIMDYKIQQNSFVISIK